MTVTMTFFQAGGTLSEDAPSYIERPADQELFSALMDQELCLVLAPRQMGKSSLMVHALSRLKSNGKRTGSVDFEYLGNQIDPEIWFGDVIYQISRSLSLDLEATAWWRNHSNLGPAQRFVVFIEDVILHQVKEDVIIFIDEIDSVLKLPFSDDFFSSIRSLYNSRALNSELKRITFVLLGVASASSFIKDRMRTPFNVGRAIILSDFDKKSTEAFQQVLGTNSDKIIDRIFYWTNGQPFLVQKLSAAAYLWTDDERSVSRIDDEIRKVYLECKIEHDIHLKPIQDFLLADSQYVQKILDIYRNVLAGKDIPDDERSPVHNKLKLSGIVRVENKRLVSRNRIYEKIFDLQWVRDHAPTAPWRLYSILSQIPLYIGLWFWWPQVREQPILAILISVLYELSALSIIFTTAIWKKLESNTLQSFTVEMAAIVSNLSPAFRKRYKRHVVNEHGVFNIRGLGLINVFSLVLDQVFVDLSIAQGNPRKFSTDLISRQSVQGRKSIWDFLKANKGESNRKVLAIIGPPGCGKTTLLQHVAITLAANQHSLFGIHPYTPIFLTLRNHIETINEQEPPTLGDLAQNYFSDTNLFPTLRPPIGWFNQELKKGKCIILLDGLDEVADMQKRRIVSSWVDNQIRNYPKCHFLLTARPMGYRDAPLQRADVVEVQPFNDIQVQKFIENWYLANEIKASGGKDDISVRYKANQESKHLIERLRATPQLSALTANPLLLTMIAMVHRYHGALPGSRAELYSEICEVLLRRWTQMKGIAHGKDPQKSLRVLQLLASYMMEKKFRDISIEEASLIIGKSAFQLSVRTEAVEDFLNDLQFSSGLLLERESGRWSFVHLTFQEYLTAAHLIEQDATKIDWAVKVADVWWHETLRLYAAQGDASPIVQACLNNNNLSSLTLAADCLEDARVLTPKLRRIAEERVVDALESTDNEIRSFAGEIKLSRRLNSLQRIDENREIDLEYLTSAEYQLFLDDEFIHDQYRQPEHWLGPIFSIGKALNPVTGVQLEDAIKFCEWLTQRHNSSVRFRLPTTNEALQYPTKTAELSGWCIDGPKVHKLCGLDEANKQMILNNLRSVSHLPLPDFDDLYDQNYNKDSREIAHNLIQAISRASYISINVETNREKCLDIASELVYAINQAVNLILRIALDLSISKIRGEFYTQAQGISIALMHNINFINEQNNILNIANKLDRVVSEDSAYDRLVKPKSGFARRKTLHIQLEKALKLDMVFEVSRNIAFDLMGLLSLINNIKTDLKYIISLAGKSTKLELMQETLDRISVSDCVLGYLIKRLEDKKFDIEEDDIAKNDQPLLLQIYKQINYTGDINLLLLKLYWWIQIIVARKKDELPAWEGIRIVKERVQ